jgi:hypothetical protein
MNLHIEVQRLAEEVESLKAQLKSMEVLPEYVPVSIASTMCGRSMQTVRNLVRQGVLTGKHIGTLHVGVESLRTYIGLNPGPRTLKNTILATRRQFA